MDVGAYLDLLEVEGPLTADLDTLELLQRAHLTAVPFENLDVYARRGVRTDDIWSVSKIVEGRRGGWCFELNGAFAALLSELGFDVTRHAATVLFGGTTGIPTHLTLRVELDRPYLVDVGFGDSFIKPLPLDSEGPHDGGSGEFGFMFEDDFTTLVAYEDGSPAPQFRFDSKPRQPEDFEEASLLLQTQPGLQWTTSRFATRLIDGGSDRVTLLEGRIKHRRDGVWTEIPVDDETWEELLEEWFGLTP